MGGGVNAQAKNLLEQRPTRATSYDYYDPKKRSKPQPANQYQQGYYIYNSIHLKSMIKAI